MKCNNCKSEWNGVKELDACPFCGANLKPEIKDKDFQSVGEFLSYVISAFGLDVLRDSRKLVSLFADLAPTLEQERNLLRIATESGVYKDILSANDESESEKQNCITICKITLESKYFMQSEWSEKAILWLTDYLGWNVKVQTAPPPAPNPVQPAQPVVVQPTQKPAAPPVQQTKTPVASQQTTAAPRQTTTTPRPAQPVVQAPSAPSTPTQTPPQSAAVVPSPEMVKAREYQKRLAIGYESHDRNKKTHIIAIAKDGKVVATGDNSEGQCNVSDWEDIVAVAAGYEFSLGLKKDGTVLCAGNYPKASIYENTNGEINEWKDIVAISANFQLAVGLKKDGTVVAVGSVIGDIKKVSYWEDIIDVVAGIKYFAGLKKDGTVIASYRIESQRLSCEKNIVAISAKSDHTLCLDKDGYIPVGCDLSSGLVCWHDIISISSSSKYTVGLKKNGTVVTYHLGSDLIYGWLGIVAVWACDYFTIGLKHDGTLVSTYKKLIGNKFKIDNWKLF